jgi:hypothetical protein
VKSVLLTLLLLLAGCEDDKAKAERLRQQAIDREVEARVMARTSRDDSPDRISPLRVAVYGVTAVGGLLVLHLLGTTPASTGEARSIHQEDRPPRSGGRVLDLSHHESPPRH